MSKTVPRLILSFGLLVSVTSCSHAAPKKEKPVTSSQEEYDEDGFEGDFQTKSHSPSAHSERETAATDVEEAVHPKVEEQIRSMSLEEKVGQLLVVGIPGKKISPKTQGFIKKIKPGSVILFGRNIDSYKQVRTLTDQLQSLSQKYSKLPALIMVDQEGGYVTRVKVGTSLPSALSLAQTRHPKFIRTYSKTMGLMLNRLGINMNLAPVLDVSDPNSASFIGSRSFGESPEDVSVLGGAFALGQWDAGVIPTAKHFPGHGGLKTDSHKETPSKNLSREQLLKTEAKPFEAFARLRVPTAMMLGHVSFPQIDERGYPAAFSKKLNSDLLRGDLSYHGLAITDDLEMAGAEKVGNIAERTVQAVLAGNDMIMVAWSEKRQLGAHKTLLQAVKSGNISEERLNQSLRRILSIKYKLQPKLLAYDARELENLRKQLVEQSKDVKKLSFQSSLRRYGKAKVMPPMSGEIVVYSSDKNFFQNFKRTYSKKSRWIPLSKNNVEERIVSLNKMNSAQPFIFYVSGTGTARWLDQLNPQQKAAAIVINSNQPGAIKQPSDFLKVVHLNSSSPESGAWLAEYLNQRTMVRTPSTAGEEDWSMDLRSSEPAPTGI